MASSSPSSLARQRDIPRMLHCIVMLAMALLDQGVLVESSIEGLQTFQTARVGEDVSIPFGYCNKRNPSCDEPSSFNLSAPNSACTLDRHGHCQLHTAALDSPFRDDLTGDCEVCEVVIQGVTQADAGLYSICKSSGACTSTFWRNLLTLEIKIDEPPTESTTPVTQTTTRDTPKIANLTKNNSETNSIPVTNTSSKNEANTGMQLSSAVGIPVTFIIIIIVIIVGGVYFYKKRTGRRRNDHSQLPPDESPLRMETQRLSISKGPDECSIEIAKEVSHLRADTELNT